MPLILCIPAVRRNSRGLIGLPALSLPWPTHDSWQAPPGAILRDWIAGLRPLPQSICFLKNVGMSSSSCSDA
jgi:hypothetical protein